MAKFCKSKTPRPACKSTKAVAEQEFQSKQEMLKRKCAEIDMMKEAQVAYYLFQYLF